MPSADVLDRKSLQPGVCKLFAWGALGMIGFFSEQRWFSRPKTSKGVGRGTITLVNLYGQYMEPVLGQR